jgi:hypothetical protein
MNGVYIFKGEGLFDLNSGKSVEIEGERFVRIVPCGSMIIAYISDDLVVAEIEVSETFDPSVLSEMALKFREMGLSEPSWEYAVTAQEFAAKKIAKA